MIIRQEKPSEFSQIYNFVKMAFQTAKVADGKEQDYVDKLRGSANYIAELALVAEEDARIVGHIMLTKTYVATGNSEFESLLIAPLSVALEYRNLGIGSKLVLESFKIAKKLGYKAVFVAGDPKYYSRFGFRSSALFGIRHVPQFPEENIMATELSVGALAGVSGTVSFI